MGVSQYKSFEDKIPDFINLIGKMNEKEFYDYIKMLMPPLEPKQQFSLIRDYEPKFLHAKTTRNNIPRQYNTHFRSSKIKRVFTASRNTLPINLSQELKKNNLLLERIIVFFKLIKK